MDRVKSGPEKVGRAEILGLVMEGNDFDRKLEDDESLGEDVALDDSSYSDTVDTAKVVPEPAETGWFR